MPLDQRLIDAAKNIINLGSCAVSKPVRAGFTTSAVIACEEMGKKLLYVAPTRRILLETLNDASDKAIRILANWECSRYAKLIEKHPILIQLPMPLPDCDKCKMKSWCELREILRDPDPQTMALTYAKLKALMLASSAMATEIKDKIERADVILFDEAHLVSLPEVVSIRAFQSLEIPEQYSALGKAYSRWLEIGQSYASTIQELILEAEQNHAAKHLSRNVVNTAPMDWHDLKIAWSQLIDLALKGLLPDDQILQLRDIITLTGATALSVGYVGGQSEEEEETGAVYLATGQTLLWQALRKFLIYRKPGASVIFGSATLFEPYAGFFKDLVGSEVKHVVFPDLRNATQKMELVPDTWTLGARNFSKELPRMVATVKAIAEREKQGIIVYAPGIKKAAVLDREFQKAGIKHLHVDYYRSDGTIGVERKERVCVTIGLAQIPSNVYDSFARGKTPEDRFVDSRRLRELSVHAATWQAINRARDPSGETKSTVYFLGVRLDQVKQVATWGTHRRLDLVKVHEFKNSKTDISKKAEFEVKVDEAIETPRIQGETKNSDNQSQRSVKDFIDRIDKNFIISQNPDKPPIYMYGENMGILGIYNLPADKSQLDDTTIALLGMFCHRRDCHLRQVPTWMKFNQPITIELLEKHVKGLLTIGTYQISKDDTVRWVCFDPDTHNGETDTLEKLDRLLAVLKKYGIPLLLEASGSIKSYHIWVFLYETKTYNAYRFCRQVKAEADTKDVESFPKQKRLNKNGKYGNQVKVPICINQKSRGRSAFLDPDTMEPLDGLITHPGLVKLLEVPDLDETKSCGIPRIKTAKAYHGNGNGQAYVDAAIRLELDELRRTTKNRNIQLTDSTKQIFSWVPHGWISESEAVSSLTDAALATGLDLSEVEGCIESARRDVKPRDPPEGAKA